VSRGFHEPDDSQFACHPCYDPAIVIGHSVSHYKVLERLGGGGMGVVYRAEDTRLGRPVALKFLGAEQTHDPVARERFLREARSASALDHPNICTIFDIGETGDGGMFIAMACYDGEPLSRRIKRGPMEPTEALHIAEQVAEGLGRAHQAGILHRDIKPANLMITSEEVVKILDFGVAKLPQGEDLTREGLAVGTLAYMAPEQIRGKELDPRSDVWSLGVVLYQMLSGRVPFRGRREAATLYAILHEDPKPLGLSAAHEGVERVVRQALSRQRATRFADGFEMAEALRQAAEGPRHQVTVTDIPTPEPAGRRLANSIAVLPFEDLSRERDQEYFCVGLAEELVLALTRVPELKVPSRTAAARVAAVAETLADLGRRLGVETVHEGTVRKEGEQLRVTAQLVQVETGYTLWSERFDRRLEDVFTIQEEIAKQIAQTLHLTLSTERSAASRPTEVEAYNLYLKGRYAADKRTDQSLSQAIDFYRRALDRAPDYARAWAGMADGYALQAVYGHAPPRDLMPRAREAATRALDLDDRLSEAHAALACAQAIYEWDWAAAEASYRKAHSFDPQNARPRHGYAVYCLMPSGRFDDALEQLEAAHELDPLSPVMATSLGLPLFYGHRFGEAAGAFRSALDLDPGFGFAHYFLGKALLHQGRHDAALEALEEADRLMNHSAESTAALAHARAVVGDRDGARQGLEELRLRGDEGYVSPGLLAQVLVGMEREEEALDALRDALEVKAVDLVWAEHNPIYETIRDHPRFLALLDQGGLTRTGIETVPEDRTLVETLPRPKPE
jgi:eukaryotic-like serine/threonine-protein kinase